MEITYTCIGEYLLPDIILREPPREITVPLGRYGRMRLAFLRDYRTIEYNRLLLSEQLFSHLWDMEQTAQERRERGVSEEVILFELVYE